MFAFFECVGAKSFFQNKAIIYPIAIGFITAVLMFGIKEIVGFIPKEDGMGWDGATYFYLIGQLAQGHFIHTDPYRLMRLGSFIPVMIAAKHHMSRPNILMLQFSINVLLLAASAGFFFDFLRRMKTRYKTAVLSTAILVFSWPFLVMSVYYPFLTDHMALILSCISLWLWQRQIRLVLLIFCAWSFFVLPGLFVVPLILFVMPYTQSIATHKLNDSFLNKYAFWGASLIVGLTIVYFLYGTLSSYPEKSILDHPGGGAVVAQPEYRFWAEIISCFLVFAASFVWANLLNSRQMWKSIRPLSLGLGCVTILIAAAVIKKAFDWDNGYTGPDIVENIFLQSLAAPAKPLVSHFLYFGPVIFLACAAFPLKFYRQSSSIPWPLLALFVGMLPILVLGSESRQWIEIFPVAVALFAFSNYSIKIQELVLFYSIALCLPVFWLKDAMVRSLAQDLPFNSFESQSYFGRIGPWVSPFVYHLALASIGTFVAGALAMVLYDRRLKNVSIYAAQSRIDRKSRV